jgi:hypothetical protein
MAKSPNCHFIYHILAVKLYDSVVAVHIKQARFCEIAGHCSVISNYDVPCTLFYSYLGKTFVRLMAYNKRVSIADIIIQNSRY